MRGGCRFFPTVNAILKKISRNFWFLVYFFVARRLPSSFFRWGGGLFKAFRVFVARRLLAHCGQHVNIESGADFDWGNVVWLGDHSDLGINCQLHGEVHIGNHTIMGPDVSIWTGNHGIERCETPIMYQESPPQRPVWIGNDVWIGSRAIILAGVRVHDHAVIAAGAVVTKDVPEWAIVGGNPAKLIRYRTSSTDASSPPQSSTEQSSTHAA